MDQFFSISVFSLVILTGILVVWALIDVFSRDLKPVTRILWIIAILIAPILGSLLYFLMGRERKKNFR